jgi:RimJ/RimL family protein N-acetyltransferase
VLTHTWDGLEVAAEDPRGTTVVVRRPAGDSHEFLLLHRGHRGTDYEGDWAWTAPAGARQPGEAVYPAALRELAEEAGISGVDLLPVDLSGRWAVFVADVPAATAVDLIDPEHDRYEWLTAEQARERVLPKYVADGNFSPATVRPLWRIGFRPMTHDDLPLLVDWRSRPHVKPWFRSPPADVDDARQRYGARIDGAAPVRMTVLEVDDRPVGYLQHFFVRDEPDDFALIGDEEAVAIDYLIGETDLSGGGLGPQMIWRYVREVVLPTYPVVPRVIACPEPENTRSVRALEKAGFVPGMLLTKPDGEPAERLCTFEVAHWLGSA